MPVLIWQFLWKYKGPVLVVLMFFLVGGYIGILRASVKNHEKKAKQLEQEVTVLKGDVTNAQMAILYIDNAVKKQQVYMDRSLAAVRESQSRLASDTRRLESYLDNVAASARAARRIEDAPVVPFWFDVPVSRDGDGLVFRLRSRPPI